MTNPTNPFNWQMPTASDLVTDLPADFETFGQAVATSMADLLGGTTGQVLSKASNTDMDFTWVAQDDSNAIQNAIVDAKGDLIAASAADTPARLAVGNNGETLVADSSTSTGLRYTANFAAGKNKIINGDFGIWQRGTTSSANGFLADRFFSNLGTATTFSQSRQTFTPGTAPVAGYEGKYFWRGTITTNGTNTDFYLNTYIEDVQTLAGQTATLSYWAKADSARSVSVGAIQNFGSGGSGSVGTYLGANSLTTSWQRFSLTVSVPSISGKTIGTGSYLQLYWAATPASGMSIDIWGIQLEAGSVATAFQTATGTLQGELAACQRYYWRSSPATAYGLYAWARGYSTTGGTALVNCPVQMRIVPTSVDFSNLRISDTGTGGTAATTVSIVAGESATLAVQLDIASTTFRDEVTFVLQNNNNTTGFLGFSAEL
jgi:hypothetical protein